MEVTHRDAAAVESPSEHERNEVLVALLGISATVLVLIPFFVDSALVIRVARILVALLLIVGVVRRSRHRWFKVFVVGIALLDGVSHWSPYGNDILWLSMAQRTFALTFLVTTAGFLIREVWREQSVSAAMILMAIGLYCLIGLFWSVAFSFLESVAPGSFQGVCGLAQDAGGCIRELGEYTRLHYFAFVTLTTLGYGDVVPVSRAAEGLATMAAVSGQLFLAILIGRLIGSYMANARRA